MTLSSENLGSFERSLRGLPDELSADVASAGPIIRAALDTIAGSNLPEEERSRRARRLADVLGSQSTFSDALLGAVRSAAPEVRAGVLAALSPESRARVYRDTDSSPVDQQSPSASILAAVGDAEEEVGDEVEAAGEWRTVLLLGEPQEVVINERFLEEHDYRGIRVGTERELIAVEHESYCAVVVHPGFWAGLDEGRSVVDVLGEQFDRSSITVYKLDTAGFTAEAEAVVDLVDGLSADARQRVTLAEGSLLNETDLAKIDRYARLLESAITARVTLESLSDTESRLLTAAASLFAAKLRSQPVPTRAHDLTVAALTDGRSGARVFRVLLQGVELGFVAKFDDVARLSRERSTASRVMPSTQPLEIEIYALGGEAVLLQRLLSDSDRPLCAAPSFKERVEARGAWERGRRSDTEPIEGDLLHGVKRLLRTLQQISSRAAGDEESRCWTQVEPLDELGSQGVVFQIESSDGSFDPRDLLPVVYDLIAPRLAESLVHGDLHPGNVLMADDRTPLLIDFANAGAGHPLFDLIRFGSAVGFFAIRPVVPEPRMRDLFTRIHVDGASSAEVAAGFPDIVAGGSAAVAIECLCAARAAAFEVLPGGEALKQYLAMTYLIAAQSLTMYEFQGATVRATLGALHPAVRAISSV